MNSWEEVKLGEVVDFFNGKTIPESSIDTYPIYGSNGILGFSRDYNFEKGIIIGRVGAYCGSIAMNKSKFWASDNTIVAKPKSIESLEFYKYLLDTMQLNNYAGGSAQPLLTQRSLKNIKLKIPNLQTQEKIADILSTYDQLIENNNQRIEILEKSAEEIYKEWFVRMRFPGYKETKFIKGIPEDWEIKRVGEIISFDIGGGWGKEKYEEGFTEKGYVIRGTDIPNMKKG